MSAKNFMTVLEFRARYGIPNTNVQFNKALEYARAGNWRGLSVKAAFSPGGSYIYPESAMKKIARVLGIPLQRVSVPKDSMTVQEFRGICPGLPKVFSRNVASYCRDSGLASAETPRRYPFSILKRCAERMGYSVPDLPVATAKKQEADTTENSDMETEADKYDKFRWQMLAATNETNRLLRELLKVWKGEEA